MWELLNIKLNLVEETNTLRILRYIRSQEATSQAEIVKHFDFSKAAVSEVVQKLIASGYVQEFGMSDSSNSVGRRRVLLQFNPLSGLVVGIDIKEFSAVVALSDLNGNILIRKTIDLTNSSSPSKSLSEIIKTTKAVLRSAPKDSGGLLGIGIGIPGVIEYSSGRMLSSRVLKGWESVDISAIFEEQFSVPVLIENSVKAITLGESLMGASKEIRNFVLLWIEDGIECGIMADGRLLRGVTSSAGEIGFIDLAFLNSREKEFPLLYSGQKNFRDILSNESIIKAYCKASNKTRTKSIKIEKVLELVSKGNPQACAAFSEIGKLIGSLGTILVNILNPKTILLGGPVVKSNFNLLYIVTQSMKKGQLSTAVQEVKIEQVKNKEDEVLTGAIGLILYELFESQTHSPRLIRRLAQMEKQPR